LAELRRKLEPEPGSPRHILTVRKVGYRLRR
jgi:DNA-binding response OmpR family regulator